jgi:ribosomal protein S27AE
MKTPEEIIKTLTVHWTEKSDEPYYSKSQVLKAIQSASSQIEDLTKEVEKLRKFKEYVHDRLDKMGVPSDPEPANNVSHGCRIEGRLNFIKATTDDLLKRSFNREDNLKSENKKLTKEVERLRNDLLDALDLKQGKGPTALSMLKSEKDRYLEALEGLIKRCEDSNIFTAQPEYSAAKAALHPLVKPERKCPNCGSTKIIMFTSDDDTCQNCHKILPGE